MNSHARRQILHLNVSAPRTAARVAQQLREASPFDTAPRYLVLDRDSKLSAAFHGTIEAMGIKATHTAYRSPWQKGVAERWIGSCRREMLDHVVVLGERHLLRLSKGYIRYHLDPSAHARQPRDPHRLSRRHAHCCGACIA